MTAETKYYTLQEIADLLKVSRQSVYNWLTHKKLHATKFGKQYRVTEEELQEFLKTGWKPVRKSK